MAHNMHYYAVKTAPLLGIESIRTGSRIIVWNHKTNKPTFVGKVTGRISDVVIIGENYIGAKASGRLTVRDTINLQEAGVTPYPGTDILVPGFRVYQLPRDADPTLYRYLKVHYVIPKESARKRTARPLVPRSA